MMSYVYRSGKEWRANSGVAQDPPENYLKEQFQDLGITHVPDSLIWGDSVRNAAVLGVGSELTISGESDLVQAIRESAQSNTARAGDQITQRDLDIQPTITIRPGAPGRVLVTRNLILVPWQR